MTQYKWLLMPLTLTCAVSLHAESVNRCTDANGKVTYSNRPCDRATKISKKIEIVPPEPAPAPQPQNNNLKILNEEFEVRYKARLQKQEEDEQEIQRQQTIKENNDRLASEMEEDRLREQREKGAELARRRLAEQRYKESKKSK